MRLRLALLAVAALTVHSEPNPGDVFRDYVWTPSWKYHVLGAKQSPIPLSFRIDLEQAVSAEAIVELNNAHLGYEEMTLQWNGGPEQRIPFPAAGPKEPSPSRYFYRWQPVIPIDLPLLRPDGNSVLLRIGEQLPGGKDWHKPYTCIYSITLRVYYNPAKKPHPSGEITSLRPNQTISEDTVLAARAHGTQSALASIRFIGEYEGVNLSGDGIYRQWHGYLQNGKLRGHLGTASQSAQPIHWDTSWLPEQQQPMRVAALVSDITGLTYFTRPVSGLKLAPRDFTVELAKPFDIPFAFTSCQYGTWVGFGAKSQKFFLHGDISRLLDARMALGLWNAPAWTGFQINGIFLDQFRLQEGDGSHSFFTLPVTPIVALRGGENVLTTIPGAGRESDIFWPGVMVLAKYVKPRGLPPASPRAPAFTNSIGMDFIRIEPGSFVAGSPDKQPGHVWEERQFAARITRPLLAATSEVTQTQFQAVMGYNPSHFRASDQPVESVSWFEAVEFARKLSELEQRQYRLPTEAEWEFMARAGAGGMFSTGETIAPWQANYDSRIPFADCPAGVYRGRPTRVKTFAPNPLGLHDMHGNVWEWCLDWYGEYPKTETIDPPGATESSRLEETRILRGGAWSSRAAFCRSAFRYRTSPEYRYPDIGFRVVLVP